MSMLKKMLRQEKGSMIILTAVIMACMLGLAAGVVDLGNLYLNRIELTNVADAAALAAAQELPDTLDAKSAAHSYAAQNGRPGDKIIVQFAANNSVIEVNASRNVPLFFAKIFNLSSSQVSASSKAASKVATAVSGAVPLSIEKQNLVYGSLYTLKEGGGSGSNGNYGALALGGNGANTYRSNLKYGYNDQLYVGQWVSTEPGNMSGPTSDGIKYRINQDPYATYQTVQKGSPRVVIVPIVDSLCVHGRSNVQIVGFGAFFLEGVGGSGHNNYVQGRFLEMYIPAADGSTTAPYYGVRTISLVK